jgi:tripartite-type tricarboxylate transporter receptor subunit TctC
MFLSAVKLKLAHVPYKGSSAALPDLVNGRVQVMFDTPITSMPFVKSGKLRALAVSGSKRLAAMPEVPTIAELGYPGFNAGTYYSVAARKGTPPAIIERLSQEIRRISAGADLAATFAPQGIDMSPGSAEELGAMLKSDRARFAKVIKDAGISIEQ